MSNLKDFEKSISGKVYSTDKKLPAFPESEGFLDDFTLHLDVQLVCLCVSGG